MEKGTITNTKYIAKDERSIFSVGRYSLFPCRRRSFVRRGSRSIRASSIGLWKIAHPTRMPMIRPPRCAALGAYARHHKPEQAEGRRAHRIEPNQTEPNRVRLVWVVSMISHHVTRAITLPLPLFPRQVKSSQVKSSRC